MADDRRPQGPSFRTVISSVLTPPQGFPAVSDDVRELTTCRCGHDHDEHRHWRPGSDCGRCGAGACTAYRPPGGALRRLLHGVGRMR